MKRNLALLLLALSTANLSASDIFWIGSGTTNWSNPAAWSGGVPPGSNDRVFFNGTGICNLDVDVTIAHFEFQTGFSGTFNQNAFSLTVSPNGIASATGMVLAGTGTFNGGNKNITVNLGNYTLNGPTFISTSDTFTIRGNYTFLSGSFNHNNGWVRLKTSGSNTITGNTTFNKLEINFSSDFHDITFAATDSLIVLDTLLKSGFRHYISSGHIFLKGDLIITFAGSSTAGTPYGNVINHIDGTGDQLIVGLDSAFSPNILENIYIDKPSGTLHLVNWITVGPDWRYIRGNLDPGTSTIFFIGNGIISGNHTLYNAAFSSLSTSWDRAIQSTDILTVSNKLEFWGTNRQDVYGGSIHAKGDIVVLDFGFGATDCGGTTTIIINGIGDQLFDGQTPRTRGFLPNIIIDKPSGTLFLKDTIVVERDWIYIRGNVDATTYNSYVNFIRNSAQTIDGEGTNGTMLFDKIGIQNNVYLNPINRNLSGNVRVKNRVSLENHLLTLNGNDLFIENESNASIQRTSGWIISETTTGNPDISRIHWSINNASAGTSYTFPFGTATTYIPLTLTVQTAGTSSGTGVFSAATYPTNTTANPNNRPLPPGVTNLNNFLGFDNAFRMLDRYWMFECRNYVSPPQFSFTSKYNDAEWNNGNNAISEDKLTPHRWNAISEMWEMGFGSVDTTLNISFTSNSNCGGIYTLMDSSLGTGMFVSVLEILDPVCGLSNGKIKVIAYNGIPPYSFLWSTGAATDSIINLSQGNYSVTVADSNGDTLVNSFLLTQNNLNIAISTTQLSHPVCNRINGKIKVAATNGIAPYSFLWNTGATTDSILNLAAGSYSVTATDSIGCVTSETISLAVNTNGFSAFTNSTDQNCTYGTSGSATIYTTGGTPPYSYQWSDNQTSQTVTGLTAGSYQYTVSDTSGCEKTGSVIIHYVTTGFYVYISSVLPNCATPGSLTASPSGGIPPYTYLWSDSQTTQTATGLQPGNYTVTVTAANGCPRIGTYSLASNCKNVVKGVAFYDVNGNCIPDSGEAFISGVSITATGGSQNYYGYTNTMGEYSIHIPIPGTFTLTPTLTGSGVCGSYRICLNPATTTFTSLGDTSFSNNFGLTGVSQFDLSINVGWTSANPGFQKQYWVNAYNESQLPFTGVATIRFNYDNDLIYASSSVTPSSHDQVNHLLTWNVSNVSQTYNWNNRITIYFDVPATLPSTQPLNSTFNIEPTLGDCDLSDNQRTVNTTVIGAVDPNAKEVSPAGEITETDSILTYTIHFQNTGNDTTHFIILRDTLSENLDAATVENFASSHPYSEFDISEAGLLTWVFNPIFLPDSFTNEPESKGFVMFNVKKKRNLPLGTEIENRVSIYFDYNEPIVTNTVKNTLSLPDWIFEPSGNNVIVRVTPNPFSNLTLITVEGVHGKFDFFLYDVFGKEQRRIISTEQHSFKLQRNNLAQGIYFYRIAVSGKTVAAGKLIIQ